MKIAGYICQLLHNENYLWLASSDSGLQSINVSDIYNPVFGKRFSHVNNTEMDSRCIGISGPTIFLSNNQQIHNFDISDAANPKLSDTFKFPNSVRSIFITGDTACITTEKKAYFFKIRNPATPIDTTVHLALTYHRTSFSQKIACASTSGKLYTINISNIFSPIIACSLSVPGYFHNIAVSDKRVYAYTDWINFSLLDISNFNNIKTISSTSCSSVNSTASFIIKKEFALFAATSSANLFCADLKNEKEPLITSTQVASGWINFLIANDLKTIAFTGVNNGHLDVYNIENITPLKIGSIGSISSQVQCAEYDKNTIYLGCSNDPYLQIIDVSDPSSPKFISDRVVNKPVKKIVFKNSNAYMLIDSSLCVFNTDSIHQPALISTCKFAERVLDLEVEDSLAWVSTFSGIILINLSNKKYPKVIERYNLMGAAAYDIALSNGYTYVADYNGGLTVLTYNATTNNNMRVLNMHKNRHPISIGFISVNNELTKNKNCYNLSGQKLTLKNNKFNRYAAMFVILNAKLQE